MGVRGQRSGTGAWSRVVAAVGSGRRGAGRAGHQAWQRGAVEVGVVVAAGALLLGAVVGTGAASTVVRVGDGLTWLADDSRGQVVQVNPATGRPQTVLQVAPAGSSLAVAQQDGRLVLTDSRTGAVTSVDLATLVASGHRQAGASGETEVLMSSGRVILAELATGRVRAADAGTLQDIGAPITVGPLSSAVVDKAGVVWLAGKDGVLRSARWSEESRRLVVEGERVLEGTGEGTALVPHERGVTVFSPSTGVVQQVGTDHEVSTLMQGMRGAVLPAQDSPRDVVPVSSADSASVVILSSGRVVEVSTAGMRCAHPGRPSVFAGRVYVPCPGDGRVLVLAPDGNRAAPEIITDGDPRLTVDDGRLIVSTPNGARATVVERDGSSRQITVRDENQPVRGVAAPPAYSPPPLPPRLSPPPQQPTPTPSTPTPPAVTPSAPPAPTTTPSGATTGSPSGTPTAVIPTAGPGLPTGPGGPGGPGVPDGPGEPEQGGPTAPTGVTATVSGTDVTVRWVSVPAGGVTFTVRRADGVGGSTTADPGSSSVVLQRVSPGADLRWIVDAVRGSVSVASAPSNAVTVGTPPTAPPTTPTTPPTVPPTTAPPATAPPTTAPPTTPPPTVPPAEPPPTTPPPAEPPPPPPPPAPPALPTEGAVVVSEHLAASNGDGTLSASVTLAPAADWAAFAGSCTLWLRTPDTGDTSSPVACGATGYYDVTYAGSSGAYGAWMTATNGVGTATSAVYSFSANAGPRNPCINSVSAPAATSSGVLVVPAAVAVPRLPQCPEVPYCPPGGPCYAQPSAPSGGDAPGRVVLAFGLLGLGALSRALRRGRVTLQRAS